VLQRVGGSIGTALLAVVLQDQIKAAIPIALGLAGGATAPLAPAVRVRIAGVRIPAPLATAFSNTFWYAAVLTGAAILAAILLAIKVRGPAATPGAPQAA
jgi:hypothetical protein